MFILPKSYFIVQGVGEADLSKINAFDNALYDAGIANYNWVCVSSILPFDTVEDKNKKLPRAGCILFCIMSRIDGVKGDQISAAIGIAKVIDQKNNKKLGLVMESTSRESKEKHLQILLTNELKEMCELRKLRIIEFRIEQSTFLEVKKEYGTALAVVVFNDYEFIT